MKSRAAVAFAAGQPLQVVEIDVEPPRAGEVLVRITASGVCHTDAFTLSGDDAHQHLARARRFDVDLDDLQGLTCGEGDGGA